MPIDFTEFLPREYHRPLQWLGKLPWLNTRADGQGGIIFQWRHVEEKGISRNDFEFAENLIAKLEQQRNEQPVMLRALLYRAFAASLAYGPKVFQPNAMQCEALENVEVEVPFSEYRQPYETLIIQLPDQYRVEAMTRYDLAEFPRFIICHHDIKSLIITVASTYPDKRQVVATLVPTGEQTIEDAFRKLDREEMPLIDRIVQRLGVNICLLMTQFRLRQRPLDPAALEKNKQLARKQDATKADRAQKMLAGQLMVVEFEQEVAFHDVEGPDEPGEFNPTTAGTIAEVPSGRQMTPHWRKGHWRRQHYGAQMVQVKLVFIRPVLVRKDRFAGDLSRTSAIYAPTKSRRNNGITEERYGG